MREAIGGTWITQLIIIFMLVFVAFLALALNYTKAFKVKNEILTIIEKREGITTGENSTIALINNYLKNNAYRVQKNCEVGSYGVASLDSPTITEVRNKSVKYYYCISKMKSPTSNYPTNNNNKGKVFYKVDIFFYFNLPVLGDLFTFDISGSTNNIATPADKLNFFSVK